jgi:serine/threonine-protein kinase
MAEVFLAKRIGPKGFEKQLVIKRILPHLSASEQFTTLFLKEARLAALVDHPNLVHVSAFGEIDGNYYLAMEYVDGTTVEDQLAVVGSFSPGVACRIAIDLLGALQAIHSAKDGQGVELGLVHRDITPRNVMITRDGVVKLLDFGIATSRDEARRGGDGDMMGTHRHMSPEQMKGGQVDARSDLFCVGVLLFQMITGEPPFEGVPDQPPPRPSAMPEDIWRLIEPTLAIAPDSRPSSARQVQGELELIVASRGLEGTRAHLAEVLGDLVPRSRPARGAISRLTQRTRSGIKRFTAPQTGRATRVLDDDDGGSSIAGRLIAAAMLIAVAAAGVASWWMRSSIPTTIEGAPMQATSTSTNGIALRTATTARVTEPPREIHAPAIEADAEPPAPPPRHLHTSPKRPKTGLLTIDTRPWTEVYLGDKKLGLTPMEGVSLPAGRLELELRNPKLGISRRLQVTIQPGRVTRVQRNL